MEIDFPFRGFGGEVRSRGIDSQRHNTSPHRCITERDRSIAGELSRAVAISRPKFVHSVLSVDHMTLKGAAYARLRSCPSHR
jgi:hypothetical protein